jgi:hypothetical protein
MQGKLMSNTKENYKNLSKEDRLIVNTFLSPKNRLFNAIYDFVFGPMNRFLAYFETYGTNALVDTFNKNERRQARTKSEDPK